MTATPGQTRLAFDAEWFDPFSSLMRRFSIVYYEADGTIELFEPSARRTFLKRCEPPEAVAVSDFYVGGSVTLFSRLFKILGFGDPATERRCRVARSSTLAIIAPDALQHAGAVINAVYASGFTVGRLAMLALTREQATALTSTRPPADQGRLVSQLGRGRALALELVGDDAVNRWHECMGPSNPEDARAAAPTSLRALYGASAAANALYGSATSDDAVRELSLVFDGECVYTATYAGAVAIVRPHLAAAGALGNVCAALWSAPGLTVTAARSLQFTRQAAEEYLDAYRGVVEECSRWVSELSSGTAYVFELCAAEGPEASVAALRSVAGPYMPEVASHIAPDSLRAQFGVDTVRNGVHVTDLPRDGPLEAKFLFHVL